MERINSSKRKRESPDEDEVGERKAAQDDAKGVVNQVSFLRIVSATVPE